jgi:hypothetical protein
MMTVPIMDEAPWLQLEGCKPCIVGSITSLTCERSG